jgi:thiamine biosynthesis protein ThiS
VTKGVPLEQAVVAVNQNFVHRETYDEVVISEGDEVEMLTAVVGG